MTLGYDIKNEEYNFIDLLNIYKKFVREESLVVEVGASVRSKTYHFSRFCKKLLGVEYLAERMLEDFDNVIYKQGDWQKISGIVEEDSVDILLSSHVLEHVLDDHAAINETYKILKKGGIAIIATPNRKRLVRYFVEAFTGPRKFPFWEHFREYTKKDLIRLLEKSDFKRYVIKPICIGILPKKGMCIKKCPSLFERLCFEWQVILFK